MSKVTTRAYVLLWCQWGGFHPNSLKLIPTQMPEDNGHISLHLIILRQYSVWIFQLAAILAVCLVRQNSTARWHGPRTFSWQIVKVVPSDFQYFLLFFVSFSRFYTCRCLIKYFFFYLNKASHLFAIYFKIHTWKSTWIQWHSVSVLVYLAQKAVSTSVHLNNMKLQREINQ